MLSSKEAAAAGRSMWLLELSRAIDEAQWLAWRIGVVEGKNPQALDLYVRLEVARAEVDRLRGCAAAEVRTALPDMPSRTP